MTIFGWRIMRERLWQFTLTEIERIAKQAVDQSIEQTALKEMLEREGDLKRFWRVRYEMLLAVKRRITISRGPNDRVEVEVSTHR